MLLMIVGPLRPYWKQYSQQVALTVEPIIATVIRPLAGMTSLCDAERVCANQEGNGAAYQSSC